MLGLYQASINQRRLTVGPDSLGWGILGASQIAERRMIEAIRFQPAAPSALGSTGSWVVGVYSHNERRAEQFAKANQIPHVCVNLDDLLSRREIQCVYVGSHPRHHFPLTMAALAAGKHVLCETPLALTLEEAQLMQQAAANRGLLLGVNHVHRADPAIGEMRRFIATGAIGDVLGARISNAVLLRPQLQTWRLQANGGGVIFDRTIHSLDLLRFLLADEIAEVTAISGPATLGERMDSENTKPVEEDVQTAVRLTRQPVLCQVHDSFTIPHYPTSVEVYGATGALVAYGVLTEESPRELHLWRSGQFTIVPSAAIDPYWLALYHFNAAVRNAAPLLATAEDGVTSLAVALAVRQSIQMQTPVRCKSLYIP
ncbi:MAG: Gfo/Idh/MocA family oxidoreductase [Caldilineaceae bacterium]